MDRIELNKMAKRIQSRLSRQGVSVTLDIIRDKLELFSTLDDETERLVEDNILDDATKPTVSVNTHQNIISVIEQSQEMVANAAQTLDLSLTHQEIKDLAEDFTHGYSIPICDTQEAIKLLKDWITHQERTASIQLAKIEQELRGHMFESQQRIHTQIRGLVSNTKKQQTEYLARHRQEMDSIYSFFREIMPGTKL